MKLPLPSIFLLVIVTTVSLAQRIEYVIDPLHTAVTSEVARFEVVKVLGRFNDVSGTINLDKSNPENVIVNILVKTGSYTANNPDGEAAVKSPAFLDIAKFPEMSFVSKKISVKDNGFIAQGDLTIHGTTKAVEFAFQLTGPFTDYPTGKQSVGIEADLAINRQDFGMAFNNKGPDGRLLVGNAVKIRLLILAVAK